MTAKNMCSNFGGFTYSPPQAKVKDTNPDTKYLHCMIHLYSLISKSLPTELWADLDEGSVMVNAIKASALSIRLFRLLCQTLMNGKRTCSSILKCIVSQKETCWNE